MQQHDKENDDDKIKDNEIKSFVINYDDDSDDSVRHMHYTDAICSIYVQVGMMHLSCWLSVLH